MDMLAPAIRYGIAPLWAAWERSPYLRHCRELRRRQYDAPEAIQARQWDAAQKILQHAYDTTAFYRERLSGVCLSPESIRSFEEFRRIPLTTKSDLRSRAGDMISRNYDPSQLHRKKTSGSTGVSLEVFLDDEAAQWKRACTLRSDEWSGWRLGESVALLWGNPPTYAANWRSRLRNALLHRYDHALDTLHASDDAMRAFAEDLRRRPPSLMFGHAHSICFFARFCRSSGGAGFRPRGIISTAMVLHDWERQMIEEVFQCPVTNRYGCEEVSLIASQCERHEGLHINADGVYVEILRGDGTPAEPGEVGRVVVTDLANRGMPILRYEVGDMAALAGRPCPCGRGLPVLERIEGRIADYVVTRSGSMISGISLTENFALKIPGLTQMQIIQEELDRFVFRIVKGPEFNDQSLEHLRKTAVERFGEEVRYECQYVDRIAPEPSGKYRFCISKVEKTFAAV